MNLVLPYLVRVTTHYLTNALEQRSSTPARSTTTGRLSAPRRPTLLRAWVISHVLFATCNFCTVFISSGVAGTILVALVGCSWALTIWAPYALIGGELAELGLRRHQTEGTECEGNEDQNGAMLGLHNAAIAAPQVVAALGCSALLRVLKAGEVEDSVGWLLRSAGIAALVAAFLGTRLEHRLAIKVRQAI